MIATRPAIPADRDFIISGWSASLRSSRDIPLVQMSTYADTFHPIIERHIARCSVLVAHGELGVLMGFIAYDPTSHVTAVNRQRVTLDGYVLYVYTAAPFRERGVAKTLFAAAGIDPGQRFGFACRTRWSGFLRSKIPLAQYEPFRARFEEVTHGRSEEAGASEAEPDPGQSVPAT